LKRLKFGLRLVPIRVVAGQCLAKGCLVIVARGTAGLAVALFLAGCGSSPVSVPPASQPTVASISPASPSPASKTPAATSRPTRAPSASPQPSLAIKPLADVFASKRTEVAWNTLTAAENALYDEHPEFESIAPRWNLIEQNLNDCGGVQPGAQRESCGAVVWQDYLLYKQSGLDEAFSTTVMAYQWALGLGIDKTWLDGYVTRLVEG
jgi:hypothetical protein